MIELLICVKDHHPVHFKGEFFLKKLVAVKGFCTSHNHGCPHVTAIEQTNK